MKKAESIHIEKGGQVVATTDRCSQLVLSGDGLVGIDHIDCYYFGRVSLTPPVIFEHLAGASLGRFFNNSTLLLGSEPISGLLYVHGRSEVLKGKHTVSSVLLANPELADGFSNEVWLPLLPSIYSKFMAEHDQSAKKV